MKTISVELKRKPYEVVVGHGLLRQAGKLCVQALKEKPSGFFVVTSPRVLSFWGKALERSLAATAVATHWIETGDGESEKNVASVERMLAGFAASGADRASVVIALGGGVIGDMAGFAASIYMRGVRIIQVPTTLLSQVDAAVGGKTGVNLPAGKNLVGTFHQPELVIADTETLSTLDERDFRAGCFEVIKCGAIRSRSLFDFVTQKRKKILQHDQGALERIVADSVKIKAEIVAADEREADLRRILNFGHTVGHALEAATGYERFVHGEAVGWGMIAAAYIGVEHGVTSKPAAAKVSAAVQAYGPLPAANLPDEALRPFIEKDKKTQYGMPHFVLLKDVGKALVVKDVSQNAIEHGLQAMRTASALRGGAHA
ncbi:MAG: 3-dehydroquinate synthase [Terriglobales bacterium]